MAAPTKPGKPGKDKGVGLLIGIGPEPESDMETAEGAELPVEEETESPVDLAAEGFLKAVGAKDRAGLIAAFRELLAAVDEEDDEPEEPPTDEGLTL